MVIGGSDLFRVIVLRRVFVPRGPGAGAGGEGAQGAMQAHPKRQRTKLDRWTAHGARRATHDITQRGSARLFLRSERGQGALTSRHRRNSRCTNASVSVLRFHYSLRTTCYASRPFIKYYAFVYLLGVARAPSPFNKLAVTFYRLRKPFC